MVREGQRSHAQDAAARPIDRLTKERAVMRPLPNREPDLDRWVTGCSMRTYRSLTSELCIGS